MSRSSHSVVGGDTDVLGPRAIAQIVDFVCVFGLFLCLVLGWAYVWVVVLGRSPPELPLAVGIFGVGFCYNVASEEYWNGQTIGKRLLGIRVRSIRDDYLTFRQIVVRNLPALLWMNWLIYLVGLLAAAVDDREQRLFDQAADTVVVED